MENQSTIARPVSLSGKGLHSGKEVSLTFKPAPVGHGIVFQRMDLPQQPCVKALVNFVHDTSRGTSIMDHDVEVKTVEHLMAALAALAIDNVLIEIDAPETPIMDGSAKLYVDALRQAGILEQDAPREYVVIDKEIHFCKKDSGIELSITPYNGFKVEVEVDYGTSVLARQTAIMESMNEFIPEIYDSRTFVFLHELQYLIANNLAQGGDVDNAIVFVDQKPDQIVLDRLAAFFNKKDIDITENGTLNHTLLRFDNEPARHKLLDLVGDLYLLGRPIKGHIKASRPGHFANTEFAKLIACELI